MTLEQHQANLAKEETAIGGIIDVATGRESIKVDIGLVAEDILYMAAALIIAIAFGYVIGNVVLKKLG